MKEDIAFVLPDPLHRKGCSLLAVGIVRQAIKDRQDAKEMLKKVPDHEPSQEMVLETERFFRSNWFQDIREFAPDVIPVDIMEVLAR